MTENAALPVPAEQDFSLSGHKPLTLRHDAEPAAASNLAGLLDRFSASVADPASHTVGGFAETIQALHGELAMLAGLMGAHAQTSAEPFDFDAIFPALESSGAAAGEPIDFDALFPALEAGAENPDAGIAAEEELEHLCREISRI